LTLLAACAAFASPASAKESARRGSDAITMSSRHLPKRDRAPTGRTMHRPAIPDPPQREALRAYAPVPDPSPQLHAVAGGRSVRIGAYFYRRPVPVVLAPRSIGVQRRRETVPNPVTRRGGVSSSKSSSRKYALPNDH
jgi:hypothetical protein